jgi:hypothetical protein
MAVGPAVEELSAVQGASALIRGMIASDGITLFSTDAKVIAYRLFINPYDGPPEPTGGARRAAYGALQARVGHELVLAFFQSQDGRTDCRGVE